MYKRQQPKLTSQWSIGLWVGRSTSSDEHIVLHENEIFRTRAVRRLAPSKQWDPQRAQGLRVFTSEFSVPTERLQLSTSDIPLERGEGELSSELQPAIQDQVEQRQPPREDVDMDFSSSSVEKRGSDDTVDSESGIKKNPHSGSHDCSDSARD